MIKKGMYAGVFAFLAILNCQPAGAEDTCLCKLRDNYGDTYAHLESSMTGCTTADCKQYCVDTYKNNRLYSLYDPKNAIGCATMTLLNYKKGS